MLRRTTITCLSLLLCGGLVSGIAAAQPSAASAPARGQDRTVPVSSVRALPGGGMEYRYLVDGVLTRSPVPPATFDPDHATGGQLREYGYPPRPAGAAALARWERAVHTRRIRHPGPLTVSAESHRIARPAGTSSKSSYSWSGYEMIEPAPGDPYANASASFHQPALQSGCAASADEASWVGLGGDPDTTGLLQAGTQLRNGAYRAWYEYLAPPDDSGAITLPMTVSPGDQIDVYVSYNTDSGQALFYVADETNQTSQQMTASLGENYWNGATADFIEERPLVRGSPIPLANYGSNDWFAVSAQDEAGSTENLDGVDNVQINMLSDDGQRILSEPSPYSGNTFTDTWFGCQ